MHLAMRCMRLPGTHASSATCHPAGFNAACLDEYSARAAEGVPHLNTKTASEVMGSAKGPASSGCSNSRKAVTQAHTAARNLPPSVPAPPSPRMRCAKGRERPTSDPTELNLIAMHACMQAGL